MTNGELAFIIIQATKTTERRKVVMEKISLDLFGECGVEISEFFSRTGEKSYKLTWTDYVVNEWTEYYPSVSLALARVSVLSECLEDDRVFEKGHLDFTFDASRFLSKQAGK